MTLNYQQGQYAQTALTLDDEETSASFTIHPAAGDASLVPARWDAANCTYTIALPEMEPDAGMTLTIRNERGLMHDNADLRARYIGRLTRAQYLMNPKSFWRA